MPKHKKKKAKNSCKKKKDVKKKDVKKKDVKKNNLKKEYKSKNLDKKSLDFFCFINPNLFCRNDLLTLRILNKKFLNSEYIKIIVKNKFYIACPECNRKLSHKKIIKFIKRFQKSTDRLNNIIPCKICRRKDNINYYLNVTAGLICNSPEIEKATWILNNADNAFKHHIWASFKNNIWDVFDSKISLENWGKCPFYATCSFNFSNVSNRLSCDECCSFHRFRYKIIRQIDNEIRKNFIEMDNILKERHEKNKFRFY